MANIQVLFNVYLKKIWLILLIGIICAVLLVIEKNINSDFMVESGDVIITKVVQITDSHTENDIKPFDAETDYKGLLYTNYNVRKFLQKTSYDINKLNGNWEVMNEPDRLNYIRQIIGINKFHNGNYEFVLHIPRSIPKDVPYLKENGNEILDEFLNVSLLTIKECDNNGKMKVIGSDNVYPSVIHLSKKTVLVKYGIVGFILGCFLTILILSIYTMTQKR